MAGRLKWHEYLGPQGRYQWHELLGQESGPVPEPPPQPTIHAITPARAPRVIAGTAVPGAMVQIVINFVPHLTISADVNGDWAFVFSAAAGNYSIEVRQIVGSLASEYTAPVLFMILPPLDPTLPSGVGRRPVGKDEEVEPPPPERPPEVGRLKVPFRRPRAWPSGKG